MKGEAKNFLGNLFHKDHSADGVGDAEPDSNAPTTNVRFSFTNKQAKYQDVLWSNLPLSARKANKVLGHDKESWDAKKILPVYAQSWADLPDAMKTACTTLGWDEASWDRKYQGTAWGELPAHVQRAAGTLGWRDAAWDADSCANVALTARGWRDFTEKERRCLHVMGYNRHNWDVAKPVTAVLDPEPAGATIVPTAAAAVAAKISGLQQQQPHEQQPQQQPWQQQQLQQQQLQQQQLLQEQQQQKQLQHHQWQQQQQQWQQQQIQWQQQQLQQQQLQQQQLHQQQLQQQQLQQQQLQQQQQQMLQQQQLQQQQLQQQRNSKGWQ